MIKNLSAIAVTVLFSGCSISTWLQRDAKPAVPPLPMDVSCDELIDHLNRQSGDLRAWQCTDVRVTARLPGVPHVPMMDNISLKGNIACEYPNRFHLTATNTFASADMGANSEQCWFQSSPGHHGVISWRSEDSHLLQEFPSQVPYIDPNLLMLVLGVKRLDPSDYVLEPRSDPHNKELWLSSVRHSPGHDAHRYVIKVDREQRVVCEHIAFDKNGAVIVRARLSGHQYFDGHLLPRRVRLELPGNNAQMTLSFSKIDTNPSIDSALWLVPSVPGGQNVDLGELISGVRRVQARHHRADGKPIRSISLGVPEFHQVGGATRTVRLEPDWNADGRLTEPDWSGSEIPKSRFVNVNAEQPNRRRFLGLFPWPRWSRR